MRQERLAAEFDQKRHVLDVMVTDVLTTQIELDKTAESYRQSHQQREALLEQWEQTIGQMKKRDVEINQAAQVGGRIVFLSADLCMSVCQSILARSICSFFAVLWSVWDCLSV